MKRLVCDGGCAESSLRCSRALACATSSSCDALRCSSSSAPSTEAEVSRRCACLRCHCASRSTAAWNAAVDGSAATCATESASHCMNSGGGRALVDAHGRDDAVDQRPRRMPVRLQQRGVLRGQPHDDRAAAARSTRAPRSTAPGRRRSARTGGRSARRPGARWWRPAARPAPRGGCGSGRGCARRRRRAASAACRGWARAARAPSTPRTRGAARRDPSARTARRAA